MVAGLLTLVLGHHVHGTLLLLAALALLPGSVFGRRGKRHVAHAQAEPIQAEQARKWRKAA
jgi:hypothetical protein